MLLSNKKKYFNIGVKKMTDYLEQNNLKNLKNDDEVERKIQLILRVGKVLMESGADTNRIVRNMKRVGVFMKIPERRLQIHITFTTIMVNINTGDKSITNFQKCYRHGVDMTAISGISKLSWRAIEQDYSLNEFEKELRFICLRRRYYKKPLVMISAGLACGGFSLLFGGDLLAFVYTSICAMIGYWTRMKCNLLNFNSYASIAISAFVATICAYFIHFLPTQTPWHPLIACSLFIVPGIPLINAIDDLVDNFITAGMTRAMNTLLMIGSMTFGIAFAIKLCHVQDFISLSIISSNSFLVCAIASAVAAIGFATIFNMPPRLLIVVACGAVISVGVRNFLMLECDYSQATASLIGAVIVSLLSLKAVHIVHAPSHVLTIPSVIPLIPGVFMYRLLFSIINLENVNNMSYHHVLNNGVNTTLILLAIAVGVAIPNIFFRNYINKLKEDKLIFLVKAKSKKA